MAALGVDEKSPPGGGPEAGAVKGVQPGGIVCLRLSPDAARLAGVRCAFPQLRNALLNETSTGAAFGRGRFRNIEKLAPVIVALVGIEVRSNWVSPRRNASLLVLPAKR